MISAYCVCALITTSAIVGFAFILILAILGGSVKCVSRGALQREILAHRLIGPDVGDTFKGAGRIDATVLALANVRVGTLVQIDAGPPVTAERPARGTQAECAT